MATVALAPALASLSALAAFMVLEVVVPRCWWSCSSWLSWDKLAVWVLLLLWLEKRSWRVTNKAKSPRSNARSLFFLTGTKSLTSSGIVDAAELVLVNSGLRTPLVSCTTAGTQSA